MKRVSDERETVEATPPIVEPVEIELPVAGVTPEIEDVRVAVRVAPCTSYHLLHHSLNTLGVE